MCLGGPRARYWFWLAVRSDGILVNQKEKGVQGHRVHAYVTVHTYGRRASPPSKAFCPPIAIIPPAYNNVITHPHIHLILLFSGYRLQRSFPLSSCGVPLLAAPVSHLPTAKSSTARSVYFFPFTAYGTSVVRSTPCCPLY